MITSPPPTLPPTTPLPAIPTERSTLHKALTPPSSPKRRSQMPAVSLSLFPPPPSTPSVTNTKFHSPVNSPTSLQSDHCSSASSSLLHDDGEIKAIAPTTTTISMPSSSSQHEEPNVMPPMSSSSQTQRVVTYHRYGIGGAGNYRKTTREKPTPITEPQLPPRQRGIKHTGIGGAGNVQAATSVPRPPSYEEHLERERILPRSSQAPNRTGIGGAGNRIEQSKDKDATSRDRVQYYSNEPLPTAIDKLTKRFARKNSSESSTTSTTSTSGTTEDSRRKATSGGMFSRWKA